MHDAPVSSFRVAHICDAFSLTSETFIYDTIVELERAGVDNHVLTSKRYNRRQRPFSKVHEVAPPGRWSPYRLLRRLIAEFGIGAVEAASWPLHRKRLKLALNRVNPDIIHAHFGPSGILARPLAREFGVPIVVSFHGFDASRLLQDEFWRAQTRELLIGAEAVLVVSRDARNRLLGLGATEERTHLVHVGIDLDAYRYSAPAESPVRCWLSIGRLTEKKGHLDTINAFRRVVQEYPRAMLTIIGDGALRTSIKAHIEKTGLQESVFLRGELPRPEVKAALAEADAFVLSSKTAPDGDAEGVPVVLMEAQAMGLPCVSTCHAGIPEGIPESNHHLLAPEGNVGQIADHMMKVMEAPVAERRMIARHGRRHIENRFSLKTEIEKIHRLYLLASSESTRTYHRQEGRIDTPD